MSITKEAARELDLLAPAFHLRRDDMHVQVRHQVERPVEASQAGAGVTTCLLQHTQANLLHGLHKGDVSRCQGSDVYNVSLENNEGEILLLNFFCNLWNNQ